MKTKDRNGHVAIFMSFSGEGGVERMVSNLARGMLDAGCRVDFILARSRGRHLSSIPEGVRLIDLDRKHTLAALLPLTGYLRREQPGALLAAKDRAIRVAVAARFLARSDVFLAGRIGTTVSAALEGRNPLKKVFWRLGMRFFYRFTDLIIAVSEGVARDVMKLASLPPRRVTVIRNPVVTPELAGSAGEKAPHPWFEDAAVPVILGMGRLTRQKDFPTLVKAFALMRKETDGRLVILGEGADRKRLEDLADELGVAGNMLLPGFQENPYPWLARCSLFVLSSRWEGSPNALTEALALGRPVVSTSCPSGPDEILEGSGCGALVPVGDAQAMAAAMALTLRSPPELGTCLDAVKDYTLFSSTAAYLEALGFNDE